MAEIKLTEDQFIEQFKPVKNHLNDKNDSWNGCMFETFGEELDHVLSVANSSRGLVWTIVECDGIFVVTSGYHLVNRIGYFVCEVPYDDANFYEVCDPDDLDDVFSEIQEAALAAYDDGNVMIQDPSDVDTCDDDLLKFVMIELSEKEGCVDQEEALRRLQSVINQLQKVYSAVEDM